MRDDLKKSFKCDVAKYDRSIYPISKNQTKNYRKKLEENGYAIVEARSCEVRWLSYTPTKKLFQDIIDKYDIENSIFESIKCFSELADLHECSMMACGSEFSLYCHARNFQYDFSYKIDFKKHKTTWKFIPNNELPPYDGYKIQDLINIELLKEENVGKTFKTRIGCGKWILLDKFENQGETWLTLNDIMNYGRLKNYKHFEFIGADNYCYTIKIEW